jgi:hypothetical protein
MFGVAESLEKTLLDLESWNAVKTIQIRNAENLYQEARQKLMRLDLDDIGVTIIAEAAYDSALAKWVLNHNLNPGDEKRGYTFALALQQLMRLDLIQPHSPSGRFLLKPDGQKWNKLLSDRYKALEAAKNETYPGQGHGSKYADMVKGKSYSKARAKLFMAGLTEFDIDVIETANGNAELAHMPYDKRGEIQCVKRLRSFGLVMLNSEEIYQLTYPGLMLKTKLLEAKAKQSNIQPEVLKEDSGRQDPWDINWDRDGITLSLGKLLYQNTHPTEKAARLVADSAKAYLAGHSAVEDALKLIGSSEQRVATRLATTRPAAPEIHWTVDEQRSNNDKYWATGSAAFWLNPNIYQAGKLNFTAEPLAAPTWWVEPEFKAPLLPEPAVDILALSLQEPKQAIDDEAERHKVLDQLIASLEAMDSGPAKTMPQKGPRHGRINRLKEEKSIPDSDWFMIDHSVHGVRGFASKEEAQQWIHDMDLVAENERIAKKTAAAEKRSLEGKMARAKAVHADIPVVYGKMGHSGPPGKSSSLQHLTNEDLEQMRLLAGIR